MSGFQPPTTCYAVLPEGPYRDSSDCTEERVRHVDHSYSIAERPLVLVVMPCAGEDVPSLVPSEVSNDEANQRDNLLRPLIRYSRPAGERRWRAYRPRSRRPSLT